MKSVQDTYLLHNGVAIPCVGYGTCDTDGEVTVRSVKCALQAGYRLIDTAMFYKNEESVGKGIRESGVPREEITVVSKLWNYDHSYEKAKKSFQESLERLGLDYLDLYLIHWPIPKNEQENYIENNRETWKAFEELYHEGKIKAIGVSNFKPHHLEEIMEGATVMPMVNQIEFHPAGPKWKPSITARPIISRFKPGAPSAAASCSVCRKSAKWRKNTGKIPASWRCGGYSSMVSSLFPSR